MKASYQVFPALAFLVLLLATGASAQCVAPTCTEIVHNGPAGTKQVLVVMGDGYAAGDQTKYNNDVQTLVIDGVFGHDFFREDQNAFNIFRLNLVSHDSGVSQRVYDEHGTPMNGADDTIVSTTIKDTALRYIWSGSWAHCWLEGSADTSTRVQNALAASVPSYNFVVVLLNQDSYGGCGGGGFQVVPRGVTWPVLAHEYGHGIGGLADEYTGAGAYTGGPTNANNCSTVTDRNTNFWKRFISPGTAVPTTFSAGMDSNRTVGIFEGCGTRDTGIYRPVESCRMRSNSPNYCPVCYTKMKKSLYSSVGDNFADGITGDFDGDGRSDVLIHNGQDLAIYRSQTGSHALDLVWTANNIVPAAPGGITWQPAPHDQYFVGDFDGDGKDDVFVFNGTDWIIPYLGLLHSDGTGLQGVARYDGSLPGFWQMTSGDRFMVGDFDGDGKADLFVFNGSNWAMPYLGLLRSNGNSLSGVHRYDHYLPGWVMSAHDQQFVGDFDGDGKADLYVFNGQDWGTSTYLGMIKSSGPALSNVKLFWNSLPGWTMRPSDRFMVGDFDGDHKADLYVFNGVAWGPAYLLMDRSTGTNLSYVHRYDSSSAAANIPGWAMRKGDRFFVSDANKDGKTDLFVYNPAVNWSTEYLGTLLSNGTALSGSWSADWVGGWNLGIVDKLLVANYEGGPGRPDIFIRNNEWFGLLRRSPTGFVMDRIYYHWIYTALYDSKPWSDSMP
ncbi:MAG TPA: M64 family metallopeptidase [Candidatus Angelobacter sp.]